MANPVNFQRLGPYAYAPSGTAFCSDTAGNQRARLNLIKEIKARPLRLSLQEQRKNSGTRLALCLGSKGIVARRVAVLRVGRPAYYQVWIMKGTSNHPQLALHVELMCWSSIVQN